jgi:hypothetical protein
MVGWELRGMTKDVILGKEIIAWQGGPKSTMGDLTDMITSVYAQTENETFTRRVGSNGLFSRPAR